MAKREKAIITKLSDVDHKLQFVNILAVINEITPIIGRNKLLQKVHLNLSDETAHNPGFIVHLKLEIDILNQFLIVAKRGFVVHLLQIKTIKNEGEVFGEVTDEEDLKLYTDSAASVKWYPEEKKTSISDTVRSAIQVLKKWKKINFEDNVPLLEGLVRTTSNSIHFSNDSPNRLRKNMNILAGSNQPSPKSNINYNKRKSENIEKDENKISERSETLKKQNTSTTNLRKHKNETEKEELTKSVKKKSADISLSSNESSTSSKQKTHKIKNENLGKAENQVSKPSEASKKQNLSTPNLKNEDKTEKNKLTNSVKTKSVDYTLSSNESSTSIKQKNHKRKVENQISNPSEAPKKRHLSTPNLKNKDELHKNKLTKSVKNKSVDVTLSSNESSPYRKKRSNSPNKSPESNKNRIITRNNTPSKNELLSKDTHQNDKSNKKDLIKVDNVKKKLTLVSNKSEKDEELEVDLGVKKTEPDTKSSRSSTKSILDNSHSLRSNSNNKKSADSSLKSEKNKSSLGKEKKEKHEEKNSSLISESKIVKENGFSLTNKTSESRKRKLQFQEENASLKKTRSSSLLPKKSDENKTFRKTKSTSSLPTVNKKNQVNKIRQMLTNSSSESSFDELSCIKSKVSSLLNDSDSSLSDDILFKEETSARKTRNSNNKNKSLTSTSDSSVTNDEMGLESKNTNKNKVKETENSPTNKKQKSDSHNSNKISTKNKNVLLTESLEKTEFISRSEKTVKKQIKENMTKQSSNDKDKSVITLSECESSISVVEVKNNSTAISDSTSNKINSTENPKSKSSAQKDIVPEVKKMLRGRNQTATTTGNSTSNTLNDNKFAIFDKYLQPLTKKVFFKNILLGVNDISFCDLEDIIVPDKYDLECKVVSTFYMIEDTIQVIRVQDGTVCNSNVSTLVIPKRSSWNEFVNYVLSTPVVKPALPFLDIIIFDYPRMEKNIVAGKCYKLNNIMGVKFILKNDPRSTEKHNMELFFCCEGQNIHNKGIPVTAQKEIQQKLNDQNFINVWKKLCDDGIIEGEKSPHKQIEKTSPEKKTSPDSSVEDEKETTRDKHSSTRSRNAKSNEPKLDDSQLIQNESSPEINHDKKTKKNLCDVGMNNEEHIINTAALSDETVLGETPALMREINDIMCEESALQLPLTDSEKVHLKNSGSQVTFTQFCKDINSKKNPFRTSTQIDLISDDIVPLNDEIIQTEEIDQMEPLVYFSGSSKSSQPCIFPAKAKDLPEKNDSEELSMSVLKNYKDVIGIKQLRSNRDKNESNEDNVTVISNSSSVKVISSNSSDVEVELVNKGNRSIPEVICLHDSHKKETSPSSLNKKNKILIKELLTPKLSTRTVETSPKKQKDIEIKDKNYHLHSKTVTHAIDKKVVKRHKIDQIETVSDNTSNSSFIAFENDSSSVKCNKVFDTEKSTLNDSNFFTTDEDIKKIPGHCFFKSTLKTPPLLTEAELNEYHKNDPTKYFSYSHNRNLPFVTFDVINKLRDRNWLPVTVTFESITPTSTDLWQERGIKSQCPNCKKWFEVYNASNNMQVENKLKTVAILVEDEVVCPDSQCSKQVLDEPEFHFSTDFKLSDGTQITALIGAKHAENIFGCTAQEVVRNSEQLNKVEDVLNKVSSYILSGQPIRILLTRKDINYPSSGPLYIKKICF